MSFYTGREAKIYDKKWKFIVKKYLEKKVIRPKNPNKAGAAAWRHLVDKEYLHLLNEKIERKIKNK